MEVATKVACGSVVAGGGGAVGAYGVHRWSLAHEQNNTEKAPQLSEPESAVSSDAQVDASENSNTNGDTGSPEGTLPTPPERSLTRTEERGSETSEGGKTQITGPSGGSPSTDETPKKPQETVPLSGTLSEENRDINTPRQLALNPIKSPADGDSSGEQAGVQGVTEGGKTPEDAESSPETLEGKPDVAPSLPEKTQENVDGEAQTQQRGGTSEDSEVPNTEGADDQRREATGNPSSDTITPQLAQ